MKSAPPQKTTIVTFKWRGFEGYRSKFSAEHVNILGRMLRRNATLPYEFVCITDDPAGITECDRVLPLWDDFAHLPSPQDREGRPRSYPSCYRRLKIFARDAGEWLGPRILALDLDIIVARNIDHILARTEDFIAWGDTNPTTHYNGGMIMLRAGARPQVWETFDPVESPKIAKAMGQFGSDQAWISACLGPNEMKFGVGDGIFSYRLHIRNRWKKLPDTASIVSFHGGVDPDSPEAQEQKWVRETYR